MKYLFLDIDGVLNHRNWYEKIRNNPELSPGPFPLECFDPECVKRVNEILEKTGAKLVISSSWRCDKYLMNTFKKVGLPEQFDKTPIAVHTKFGWKGYDCRGSEIQEYLDKHKPYESYVILDDDNDMLDSQRQNFVRTRGDYEWEGDDILIENNGGTGLTDILKEKAIEILNKKGDD